MCRSTPSCRLYLHAMPVQPLEYTMCKIKYISFAKHLAAVHVARLQVYKHIMSRQNSLNCIPTYCYFPCGTITSLQAHLYVTTDIAKLHIAIWSRQNYDLINWTGSPSARYRWTMRYVPVSTCACALSIGAVYNCVLFHPGAYHLHYSPLPMAYALLNIVVVIKDFQCGLSPIYFNITILPLGQSDHHAIFVIVLVRVPVLTKRT